MWTFDDIAETIASGNVSWGALTGTQSEIQITNYWNDIRTLATVKIWRSVMANCGQIVEGLVRHRLLDKGLEPGEINKKTLGQLLALATEVGILPAEMPEAMPNAVLSSALILRNWSSHYSAYAKKPDGRQAAQALVLLVASAETLYSASSRLEAGDYSSRTTEDPFLNWKSIGPARLVTALENLTMGSDLPSSLVKQPRLLADHFAQFGAPRSIARFETFLSSRSLSRTDLRESLAHHFATVIRNASRGSYRRILELLLALRRMDLDTHATVAGILLPTDAEFLAKLLRTRAPAYVAYYFAECFKANRAAMSARMSDPKKRAKFVTAFWEEFGGVEGSVVNMANVLAKLPPYVRVEILKRAPASLLDWLANSDPVNGTNLLSSLSPNIISSNPRVVTLRERVVKALVGAVEAAPPDSLAKLPLRLRRIKAIDDTRGLPILVAVLNRVATIDHFPAIRRILWDTYSFCPSLKQRAMDIANRTLQEKENIPVWERMCLVGMLSLVDTKPPGSAVKITEAEEAAVFERLHSNVDRWQIFLVVLALSRLPVPTALDADLARYIQNLLNETVVSDVPSSGELLDETRKSLQQLSPTLQL